MDPSAQETNNIKTGSAAKTEKCSFRNRESSFS
jgi:hypothetical protein